MWPDISGFFDMLYGTAGVDLGALTVWQFGNASGQVWSGNPPYTATDFLGFYKKFFGPPTFISGVTITEGSAIVTGLIDAAMAGLAVGQLVLNLNSIPKDSVITAIGTDQFTISNNATANDTTINIYEAPPMPLVVILWFVTLAAASVMQARYLDGWMFMMALFIAHFCTLWMRSETGPNSTPSQIVTSGLEKGMLVSKSAGDVSAGIKFLDGYEQWGAMQETTYGVQFMSMARAINCGPIWVQ